MLRLRHKRRGLWPETSGRALADAIGGGEPLEGLVARDRVFATDADALTPALVAAWEAVGFTVYLPEHATTIVADLAAVSPTVLVATAARLDALARDVEARLPPPGTWRRGLVDSGLAGGRVGHAFIRAPLRRTLGLARTRLVIADGEVAHAGFYDRLGLAITVVAPPAPPLRLVAGGHA